MRAPLNNSTDSAAACTDSKSAPLPPLETVCHKTERAGGEEEVAAGQGAAAGRKEEEAAGREEEEEEEVRRKEAAGREEEEDRCKGGGRQRRRFPSLREMFSQTLVDYLSQMVWRIIPPSGRLSPKQRKTLKGGGLITLIVAASLIGYETTTDNGGAPSSCTSNNDCAAGSFCIESLCSEPAPPPLYPPAPPQFD